MRWRQGVPLAKQVLGQLSLARFMRCRLLTTAGAEKLHRPEVLVHHDEDDELTEQLREYSHRQMQPVHLDGLIHNEKHPCPRSWVQSLRKEIPTRLSHALTDLMQVPDRLGSTPSFNILKNWYLDSFRDVSQFYGGTVDEAERFTIVAESVLDRHTMVIGTLSDGLREVQQNCGEKEFLEHRELIQHHTDRFLLNRISMRLLLSRYCNLFGNYRTHGEGEIQLKCDVVSIIQEAAEYVRNLTSMHLTDAPEVTLDVSGLRGNQIKIPYVPCHIRYMMVEIMKNACKATVEHCRQQSDLPEIIAKVEEEEDYVTITVTDVGGGMSKSVLEQLFHYNFSTADPELVCHGVRDMVPLAGCGFGLKLSRLFATYLGGHLVVTTDEGQGTAVSVSLKRRAATEVLHPSLW